MKKENMLAILPEEITIDLPCTAKIEISENQLLVNNRIVAIEEDDHRLFDLATIAINSLLSCDFDVAFTNHDTGEEKGFWHEN